MLSRLHEFNYLGESYFKFLKAGNKRQSLPPKEYGIRLQMKKKGRRK